jgi:hypothetical protein
MIQGQLEPIESLQALVIFDWLTGAKVADLMPDYYGAWIYDGDLPTHYGILYRADKCAPRVEGPYR